MYITEVFSSWGICLTITLSKSFHISPTILWYLVNRESHTSYSPKTRRVMICESVKSISLSAQTFLANLKLDSKVSYLPRYL